MIFNQNPHYQIIIISFYLFQEDSQRSAQGPQKKAPVPKSLSNNSRGNESGVCTAANIDDIDEKKKHQDEPVNANDSSSISSSSGNSSVVNRDSDPQQTEDVKPVATPVPTSQSSSNTSRIINNQNAPTLIKAESPELKVDVDEKPALPSGMATRARTTLSTLSPTTTGTSTVANEPSSSLSIGTAVTVAAEPMKKPKKKTVTFKTVLETSDDIIVKKVYNPDMVTSLVPIIKRESMMVRSGEGIVKPSRLTGVVQSFNNRLKSLSFGDVVLKAADEKEDSEDENDDAPVRTNGYQSTAAALAKDKESTTTTAAADMHEGNNIAVGDKRFILPKRSLHSSRVIKPNKKFLDDINVMDGCSSLKRLNKCKSSSGAVIAAANNLKSHVTIKEEPGSEVKPLTVTVAKSKSISFQEETTTSKLATGADTVPEIRATTSTSSSLSSSLVAESNETKKQVANLFGQAIASTGSGELNLTPFGSNKVILRQPRLQFAMHTTTAGSSSSSLNGAAVNLFSFSAGAGASSSTDNGAGVVSAVATGPSIIHNSISSGSGNIINSCILCRKATKIIQLHDVLSILFYQQQQE